MRYAAELFYWQDQQDFPFQKAVLVTAKTVAQWCAYFHTRVLSSSKRSEHLLERKGALPTDTREKEAFVTELLLWLWDHSDVEDVFYFLLDDEPVPQAGKVAKFDHHDDTCCWFLNLTESEFLTLQDAWRNNDLPIDLFYPEQKMIRVPYPGNGWKAKALRLLGVQRCYTPLQWQKDKSTQDRLLKS